VPDRVADCSWAATVADRLSSVLERRYFIVVPSDREALLAELEAIEFWDQQLILQERISALDKLSYDLRKERKAEIEAELRRRDELQS
jgi:hypothetical protein